MLKEIVKNDENLKSNDTFVSLIKAFTAQCLYGNIGKAMFNANYSKLQYYLRALMDLNTIYGMKYSYKKYHEPIYRGMGINGRFDKDHYQPNTL